MTYWSTLAQVIQRVAKDTGKAVTEDDILEMAEQGHIQVSARLPIRKGPGNKEAQWYYDDGTPVGMASVATDGVLRRLDQYRLQQLMLHDGVDLAGARWDIPGGSPLIAGPEAGFIGKADICVAEPEYRRILAMLGAQAIDGVVNTTREKKKSELDAEIKTAKSKATDASSLSDLSLLSR